MKFGILDIKVWGLSLILWAARYMKSSRNSSLLPTTSEFPWQSRVLKPCLLIPSPAFQPLHCTGSPNKECWRTQALVWKRVAGHKKEWKEMVCNRSQWQGMYRNFMPVTAALLQSRKSATWLWCRGGSVTNFLFSQYALSTLFSGCLNQSFSCLSFCTDICDYLVTVLISRVVTAEGFLCHALEDLTVLISVFFIFDFTCSCSGVPLNQRYMVHYQWRPESCKSQ